MARPHILNGFALLFPLALLLVFGGCRTREPYEAELPLLKPGDPVLAIGDSLTKGFGAGEGESYPEQLATITGLAVTNAGVDGETSAEMLERIDTQMRLYPPKLVIVITGGNDFLRSIPARETKENLRRVIQRVRRARAAPLIVAVPKKGFFMADAGLYYEVSKKMRAALLSDVLADLLSDSDFKSDAIHLNAKGYRALAEAIAKFLREKGALQ